MRKLILLMNFSSDGFVSKPNGEIDWLKEDADFYDSVGKIDELVDTVLLGRITYLKLKKLIKTPFRQNSVRRHYYNWIKNLEKIVFSRTFINIGQEKTKIVNSNIREQIIKMKNQPGKNILLLGSPTLARILIQLDLINEFRIYIHPVLLNRGNHFIEELEGLNLKFREAKKFNSGIIELFYELADVKGAYRLYSA